MTDTDSIGQTTSSLEPGSAHIISVLLPFYNAHKISTEIPHAAPFLQG